MGSVNILVALWKVKSIKYVSTTVSLDSIHLENHGNYCLIWQMDAGANTDLGFVLATDWPYQFSASN